MSKLGTRVAGTPNAQLHRIQTLLSELTVSVTPAAEAPKLDIYIYIV